MTTGRKKRGDGWETLVVVVTDDVAADVRARAKKRYSDMDVETRRKTRAVCDAKGWNLDDVLLGLAIADTTRVARTRSGG